MKGHVKLTTAEHRAWRVNKAQWVSRKGIVLRAVTPEEEQAIFPVVERSKRTGRSEQYTTKVVYKVRNTQGQVVQHEQPMEVVVRSTRTGREAQSFLLDVFVNGNRYVKGRDIIEKRMLARHGECILFQPNGKRLRVIRNPKLARPTYAESQRAAPHPDHCGCRAFSDRREPGRHHIACEWNSKAPPHEQASPLVRDVLPTLIESPEPLESLAFDPSAQVSPLPAQGRPQVLGASFYPPPPPPPNPELVMRAGGPISYAPPAAAPVSHAQASMHPTLGAPVTVSAVQAPAVQVTRDGAPDPRVGELEVYAPEECPRDCRGARNPESAWPWPLGRRAERGVHHPLCPFEVPHRQSLQVGQRWVLFDIARQTEVREATRDEVARSEIELQRTNTRSVVISGRIYAVVAAAPRPAAARRPRTVEHPEKLVSDHERSRQQALADSGLPGVPGAQPAPAAARVSSGSPAPSAREQALLDRLAQLERQPAAAPEPPLTARERALMERLDVLERRSQLSQPVGPGVAYEDRTVYLPRTALPYVPPEALPYSPPQPPPMIQPQDVFDPNAALMQSRPVASAADHLRNDKGLVGHQQLGDDIPVGEVELDEPVAFVDPLPAMQVHGNAAPAPYHPGVVHAEAFVPPALPTDFREALGAVPSEPLSDELSEEALTVAPSAALIDATREAGFDVEDHGQDLGGPDDDDEQPESDEETLLTGFEMGGGVPSDGAPSGAALGAPL